MSSLQSARRSLLCGAALFLAISSWAQTGVRVVANIQTPPTGVDWLVTPVTQPVELQVTDGSATPAHLALANGVIARVWNLAAAPAPFTLTLVRGIASADQTTHLETDVRPAPLSDGALSTRLNGQQLRTFRLRPRGWDP